jgi:hypothetical protein
LRLINGRALLILNLLPRLSYGFNNHMAAVTIKRGVDEMDDLPHLAQQCHVTDRSLSSRRLCDVGGVHRSRSGEVGVSGSRR